MSKAIKIKLICVTVFSIICIIITSLLIMYKNIDIADEQISNENVENPITTETVEEQGIDLKGKYNKNYRRIFGN